MNAQNAAQNAERTHFDVGFIAGPLDGHVPDFNCSANWPNAAAAYAGRYGFAPHRVKADDLRWVERRGSRASADGREMRLDHARAAKHPDGRRGLIGYEYPRGGDGPAEPVNALRAWCSARGLEFHMARITDGDSSTYTPWAVLICEPRR
jgi:hypothetical protein